jgi:hypothetical protein
MLHRRVEHPGDRAVAVGHAMIQLEMAAIALLIVGMAVLDLPVVS